MQIELLYMDGCPNWRVTETRLRQVMARLGLDPDTLTLREVSSEEQAQQLRFVGSPTVVIDGVDAIPTDAPPALACRTYSIGGTLAGTPGLEQLQTAIENRRTAS